MNYARRIINYLSNMGCCFSCKEDSTNQVEKKSYNTYY